MSFRTMNSRQNFKTCRGPCAQLVPPHVTINKCRYCQHITEHPVRRCDTCSGSFSTRRTSLQTSCSPCVERLKKEERERKIKTWVEQLGLEHKRRVLRVKLLTHIEDHDGYCSDPEYEEIVNPDGRVEDRIRLRKRTIKQFVYFPAPWSIVCSKSKLEDLMEGFDCKKFASNTDVCCRHNTIRYEVHSYEFVYKGNAPLDVRLQSLETLYKEFVE
jgi:hypothetical protein